MSPERWQKLDFSDRVRAIASEIKRAEIWEEKDEEIYQSALERALELVELSLDYSTNKKAEAYILFSIKERLGELYAGLKKNASELYAAF